MLVNELGEIGLDHLLMENVKGDVIALAGGCLCCTVRSDLIDTLEDLLMRRDAGEIAFSRVILETTGLADPVPVLQSLIVHPLISLRYALDGVVTAVDAVLGAKTLTEHEEARRQVAVADRIVITKTDMPDAAEGRPALDSLLGELAPAVPKFDSPAAGVSELFTAASDADYSHHGGLNERFPATLNESAHAGDIRTTVLWSDAALPPQAFGMFIDLLRSEHGAKILRLKGLVRAADDPDRPVVIHGVQHMFHPPQRLASWPDADRRTRLVVIGKDIDGDLIARLYDALSGVPGLDTPDRSVLFDNPLAPPGLVR